MSRLSIDNMNTGKFELILKTKKLDRNVKYGITIQNRKFRYSKIYYLNIDIIYEVFVFLKIYKYNYKITVILN